MSSHVINGFSTLARAEKLIWLQKQADLSQQTCDQLNNHLHSDPELQKIYGDISENYISNYYMPLGLAPNFLINNKLMTLPMVIEESSVVAAASHAAKFWALHGGFHTKVAGKSKNGQVYFTWTGNEQELQHVFSQIKNDLLQSVKYITQRMEERGGGIEEIEIKQGGSNLPDHYHLFVTFQTADAMGANFINSVLEALADKFVALLEGSAIQGKLEVILSILSNYTPGSRVICYVEEDVSVFQGIDPSMSGNEFAQKFKKAVQIAIYDPYRAVTHNKGIFNGMDAVTMATGNDFRAVEACGHAYASRNGKYSSLSKVELSEKSFRFTLDVPMSVGTIGGLTRIHPLANASLEILGFPSADQLMQVIAAAGLATNFSAVRSLITTGIQQGHMKMHLGNVLKQLKASPEEIGQVLERFKDHPISFAEIATFLESYRDQNNSR